MRGGIAKNFECFVFYQILMKNLKNGTKQKMYDLDEEFFRAYYLELAETKDKKKSRKPRSPHRP